MPSTGRPTGRPPRANAAVQRRRRFGYRQSDLAALIGCSKQQVSDVEGGNRGSNDATLGRWAGVLAWTLEDLLAALPERKRRGRGVKKAHRRASRPRRRVGAETVAVVVPATVRREPPVCRCGGRLAVVDGVCGLCRLRLEVAA